MKTKMKPEKLLRKRFVYNINRQINRLRKDGKV